MDSMKNYIESGMLEMYVLGCTTAAENQEVMQMAVLHTCIRQEIEKIHLALHHYINFYTIHPAPSLKNNVINLINSDEIPKQLYKK